ncbi:putative helicase MOV-10 [Patella vulgata]|uniref:putative helicase MOV-10 n=1 Tax=Patella vulgata TaxID=6465 RepID=UPI0024A90E46|nr:putative helicase MOV-10 [Patella vulgata]
MSKVISFNDRLLLGKELLKYAKNVNTNFSEIAVKELELLYINENFKVHLSHTQLGVTTLPPFVRVLQPLETTHKVQVRRGVVMVAVRGGRGRSAGETKGPPAGTDKIKENGASRPNHREHQNGAMGFVSTDNVQHSRQRKRSRGRRRNPATKLAVDQHLMINKPPGEAEATGAGTEKLPKFIHVMGNLFNCVACGVSCTSRNEMEKHITGRRHRVAEVMHGLRNRREELVQEKQGVVIKSNYDLEDGIVEVSVAENEVKSIKVNIKNTHPSQSVELIQCEMLKRIRIFQLDDAQKITEGRTASVVLTPGSSYCVLIRTQARNVGSFHTPLAFHFQTISPAPFGFHIVRYLHARCQNKTIENMKPTQKYKRPPRKALKKPANQIVDGFKLPSTVGNFLERELDLKTYYIPDSLRHIINRGLTNTKGLKTSEKIETTALRTMLEGDFSISTYQKRMDVLMHCEEIQMEVDIRQYDMEAATLSPCVENSRLLVLKVPGLAENRPSVLRGDWLFVRVADTDDKEYKGYVHEVCLNEVRLGFHKSLSEIVRPDTKFHVRFVFSRLPMCLQHRACELVNKKTSLYKPLLFPTLQDVGTSPLTQPVNTPLRFYSKIPVNPEQERAIRHIVAGTSRPAPYLVFGPPGTGKTFTIVEAMKQVLTCDPGAHVLACTPSNNAADLLTERLLDNREILGNIIRLNAVSRSWRSIPDKVKNVSNYDKKTNSYYYPCKKDLKEYRVIVCTVITAGRLASAKFPVGHFTHVFIDEAGHAIEPESMIAVTNILDITTGQLVLAGDQKQLGPILRSPFAIKYGLGMSLLERYMTDCGIYSKILEKDGICRYNPNVLTKLVKNYRSHRAILHQPNILFYDGELQTYADPKVANEMCGWECLPNKNFPIIFHSVYGEELREERSPSFFNPEEAYLVLQYVKDLKKLKGSAKLEDKDIGIISPYQKQVRKIQRMMSTNGWKNIRVGSVEEFQGQERKVIIVSTVRSSPEFLSLDINFKLGFLRNPKRFNVTVTRAKALLIIVGNPNILTLDDTWSSFIDYIKENGGLAGTEQLDDQDDMLEDIIQRLNTVQLTDIDIETASHFNDQSWRQDI